jgi:two-component sensor histidine kinase
MKSGEIHRQSLTVESGQVSITWTSEDQEGEPKFVFVWREFGGPPASEPAGAGFGSRLISRVLQDDFGGAVEVTYGATGLVCRLTVPLENLATSSE